jgi:uncharacterized protein (DUF58 family)
VPLPTGRLFACVAVATLVVLLVPLHPPVGLLGVDAILLVLAAVDAWLAPAPHRIGVERQLPPALTLGAGGEVRWRVHNPIGRTVRLALADELAPSLRAGTRRVRLTVPAAGSVTATTRIEPRRRGRFEPTEIVVRVDGPLGLASRQGRRSLPGVVRVLPPFRSRKEAELRIDRARLLEIGLRSAQGRGGGTEFEALREYTVDDEVRRMDWAATARSGRAIVRTYRSERNQQILVLLDNGRVMAGEVAGVPRIELAMDAAMALTAVATRLGDRCGLVTFDRQVRAVVAPAHGKAQLTRVVEAMYDLEPQLVESDYLGAFSATVARFRRRALLVLVTELTEEAVTETLVPALPLLLARHLVIVASASDPDVIRWSDGAPTDARSSYRAAAAASALERRGQAAARLRALGATVVDAPPSALATRLVDAYLDVKAAGSL